jgi:hypothetical protein
MRLIDPQPMDTLPEDEDANVYVQTEMVIAAHPYPVWYVRFIMESTNLTAWSYTATTQPETEATP